MARRLPKVYWINFILCDQIFVTLSVTTMHYHALTLPFKSETNSPDFNTLFNIMYFKYILKMWTDTYCLCILSIRIENPHLFAAWSKTFAARFDKGCWTQLNPTQKRLSWRQFVQSNAYGLILLRNLET